MFHTYILRSIKCPDKIYVGFTKDLKARLKKYNEGGFPNTAKFRLWKLEFYSAFNSEQKALEFEHYLKSHSGKAFT